MDILNEQKGRIILFFEWKKGWIKFYEEKAKWLIKSNISYYFFLSFF